MIVKREKEWARGGGLLESEHPFTFNLTQSHVPLINPLSTPSSPPNQNRYSCRECREAAAPKTSHETDASGDKRGISSWKNSKVRKKGEEYTRPSQTRRRVAFGMVQRGEQNQSVITPRARPTVSIELATIQPRTNHSRQLQTSCMYYMCVCRHETDDSTISDISLHGDRLPPRRSDESCDVSEFVIVSFAHSSPLECTGHRCRAFVSRYCQRTFTSRDVAKFLSTQSILAYWCVLFFAETITKPSSLREERTSWSSITRVSRAPPSRPNSFFRTVSQTSERWRLCSTPRAPTRSIPENEERIQRFGGTLTSIPTARHCRNSLLPRSCSRSRESAGRYAKPVALSAANFSNHLYAFTRFVIASLYIRNYENCRNRSLAFSRFSKSDGVVFSVRSDPFF